MKILRWDSMTINQSTLTATVSYAQQVWITALLQAKDHTGKHYFEVQSLSGSYLRIGLCNLKFNNYWYLNDYRGGSYSSPTCTKVTIPSYALLGRIMVAYDLDAGKIWFGVNGVWFASGDPENNLNPSMSDITVFGVANPVFPYIEMFGGDNVSARFYFYQSGWLYAPAGFSEATEFETSARAIPAILRRDTTDGGALKIIEPVTRMNSPVSRRVRLCDQISGRVVREQWSDPATGLVTFTDLREGPWLLYGLDHTSEFEAVAISDRVATVDGARP